jgi:hypothetical protein
VRVVDLRGPAKDASVLSEIPRQGRRKCQQDRRIRTTPTLQTIEPKIYWEIEKLKAETD